MVRLRGYAFNRTYEELKFNCNICYWLVTILLIVPMRNWNVDVGAFADNIASFNRTYEELKYWIK